MTTFAVTRTKNEADIIEATITRMQGQVDHVVVGDGSDDGTWEILKAMPGLTLVRDDTPTFEQAEQMTKLAEFAKSQGAEWVVPFDADEAWFTDEGRISARLAELPENVLAAEAPLFNHIVTAKDDPGEPDPITRMGWRSTQAVPLRKVAFRTQEGFSVGAGNHGVSYPNMRYVPSVTDVLEVHHFPYRSAQQFINKISVGGPALAASNAPESFGAHWRAYYRTLQERGPEALVSWFEEWAYSEDPESDPELVFDPCLPSYSHLPGPVPTAQRP